MEVENKNGKTIAIIGSRKFNNRVYMWCMLEELKEKGILDNVEKFISGGAKGADKEGEFWARKNKLDVTILYPDYDRYGRGAPLIRNTSIIEGADVVVAFPTKDISKSRGTNDAIKKAQKLEKELYIFDEWEESN